MSALFKKTTPSKDQEKKEESISIKEINNVLAGSNLDKLRILFKKLNSTNIKSGCLQVFSPRYCQCLISMGEFVNQIL